MAGRKAAGTGATPASPGSSSTTSTKTKSTTTTAGVSRTHRGLTCANCRARKTRCDGSQPTCKTCEVYRDTCRYEKPPPMSQIVAMARRLQEAEEMVVALKAELAAKSASTSTAPMTTTFSPAAPTSTPQPLTTSPIPKSEDTDMSSTTGTTSRQPSQDLLFDLSVDSNGKLCYVGPTSAVHNPPVIEAHTSPIQTYDETPEDDDRTTSEVRQRKRRATGQQQQTQNKARRPSTHAPSGTNMTTTKADVRALLTTTAIEARAWEAFALGSAAAQTDLPRAALARLLQIHWVWIAPMFMWVYRPAFMRDMARGEGKYYSPLLLIVLCGHAARFEESTATTTIGGSSISTTVPIAASGSSSPTGSLLGDALISRARLLLGAEIHKPSSIPTVQALLQLSARDLAYGHISQAWLYSGMAFRMVSDLGLQHSSSGQLLSLGHLNAEDLEVRRRLYWSCYFWDKAMSLYLGRMPTLVDLPLDASPELLDDFAEHELWSPPPNTGGADGSSYPPMKSHAISCFANTCRLAVILCDIILQLYSRRRPTTSSSPTSIQSLRDRLDAWRAATPPHLLVTGPDRAAVCPPPHILTQNLLYYTTLILLHRPFYSSPVHHAACRQAADHLERLLLLLERTFGFRRITYLMAYCVYTGASVLVQDIKQSHGKDAAAASKIQTFLRALRLGVVSCPLVRRSLDIITDSLGDALAEGQPAEKDVVVVSSSESDSSSSSAKEASVTAPPTVMVDPVITTPAPPHDDPSSSTGTVPSNPLLRNYLPAFPYYHAQLDFFDTSGSGNSGGISTDTSGMGNGGLPQNMPPNNTFGPGSDPYDMAAMDIDAFSLLDCFPENHLDSATAAAWYMPQ
ncbi:hypothetical protein Sste5346_006706 [Sporothrix stenoceras]|uniref:Zn(2)-C6 fungal-type domain-containing protein n=1 Tax=Sporothrix stenoceras TaxID=5173 RepID=A0ABR3YYV2_9PEZI